MQKPSTITTWLYLLGGMACFGSGTPVSKLVTTSFPVFAASGFRMLVAFVFLLPFLLSSSRLAQFKKLDKKTWALLVAISFFGMFLFSLGMLMGMKTVSGATGSIIMSTMPAVVATASVIFMGDRMTPLKIGALILAVGGLLIIHTGMLGNTPATGSGILQGTLLVFGAVCCEAAYTLLGKKAMETLDAVSIAAATSLMALLFFLPLLVWEWGKIQWQILAWQDWFAIGWWGAGTLGVGTILWYRGVKEVKGSVAAGFMGVMPLSALLLSYVLLNEQFEWAHAVGMALELAAIGIMAWASEKSSAES